MNWLSDKKIYFIGQSVKFEGTGMYNTLKDVNKNRCVETPVFENTQLGMCTGMTINGIKSLAVFPRINFLLCAIDQLVNHLDKLALMSDNQYKPHLLIRTAIGSEKPLWPGYQHIGDYTEGLRLMCKNIEIIRLDEPEQILPAYQHAYSRLDKKSSILVEFGDYYTTK